MIAADGNGLLIYDPQEGRGIGILNKLKAYQLQDGGADTVEANEQLGFEADQRDYSIATAILRSLGVERVRFLSNNPSKVRALEEAGVISRYCALVDEKKTGFDVSAFAMVGLHRQSEADLVAFEERVGNWPIVRECFMLSGEIDFILKCVAQDLTAFQDFIINELTAAPNVDSVKTSLAIRRSKFQPGVPAPSE